MHPEVTVQAYIANAGTTAQEKRILITSSVVDDMKDPGLRLVLSSEFVTLSREDAVSVLHSLVSILTEPEESRNIILNWSSAVPYYPPELEALLQEDPKPCLGGFDAE